MFHTTLARIRAFFHTRQDDRDFAQEMESHLSMLIEEKVRAGMRAEDARREALVEVGGLAQLSEAHREVRGLPFVDTFLQDLRFTFRTLRRDAGFTIFAILIIGLGIGASSTVFSVVNAVVLRPLPFADSGRLVWISNIADNGVDEWRIQVGHYLDLREQNKSFTDLTAYHTFYTRGGQMLTGGGEPERLTAVPVAQNFFPFLGVQPILGRNFTEDECKWNGPKAVLLSHSLWQRRFASDRNIVGRSIVLNDAPTTIVGVVPASFNFGTIFDPGLQADMYAPFPLSPETHRWGNILAVIGRLKPGATLENARAEFQVMGKHLTQKHLADRNDLRPKLMPLDERINGRFRPALFVLIGAVAVVMLIVCANLSNLQLARTATRQKEMAVRIALGARRGRLIRQLLTESVVLSCCGAVAGLIFCAAATGVVARMEAFQIPLLETVRMDLAVFSAAAVIAIVSGVLFGLMPAFHVRTAGVQDALKNTSRGSSVGKRQGWIRSGLIASEIAFACMLLVGAGLLIRSFLRVLDVSLGFQPERVAALRIDPNTQQLDQPRRTAYFNEALNRVRPLAGIRSAALTDILPLTGNMRSWGVAGRGQIYKRGQFPQAFIRVVSEGYFHVMGIPLRAGRDFSERDIPGAQPVVIINESLARMLWPGQNAIGQVIDQGANGAVVIGVAGDVRHKALEEGFTGEMYLPIRQRGGWGVDLLVRTDLDASALTASVRTALEPIAPNLVANEWRPLRELVDRAASPRRFVVLLLAGFSGFALILASLGIYSVVSYSVNRRKQEIGIRMALGEPAGDVRGRILMQTLRLAGAGLVAGTAASWMLGRALSSLLFGVTATDPVTFTGMALLLTGVALIAGYLPARRASQIDPIVALRAE